MSNRWSIVISLAAFLLLVVVSLVPVSWSQSLPSENNEYITPVSQLQGTNDRDQMILPATSEGNTTVDAIQSLQYHPPAKTSKIQSVNPDKPVSVSPVAPIPSVSRLTPTFAVFPVLIHSNQNKAFSDLPVLLASSVANELASKASKEGLNYGVLNPLYTYDDLKEKGLDGLYEKVVRDYLEAGQPNEKDLTYLADQLSTGNKRVFWVVFVNAELDTNHMSKPSGFQILASKIIDEIPSDPNYFIKATIQTFSTEDGVPLVWDKTANTVIPMQQFGNFTKSVFDDSDSAFSFKKLSVKLAHSMVSSMPQATYATVASVQATLAPSNNAPANVTPQDQETLKKLLTN